MRRYCEHCGQAIYYEPFDEQMSSADPAWEPSIDSNEADGIYVVHPWATFAWVAVFLAAVAITIVAGVLWG